MAAVSDARSSQPASPLNLERSAYRTFIVLVAPALNALGWKLNSPKFWFVSGTGSDADARFVHDLQSNVDGRATAAVETRALGSDITEGVEVHLERCRADGIPIFAITDGRYWRLYPIISGVRPDAPAAVCDVYSSEIAEIEAMAMLKATAEQMDSVIEWIPLPDYDLRTLDKPAEIMFPDGSTSDRLQYVYHLQLFIVDWLYEKGVLKLDACPITTARGVVLVAEEPIDARGKPFRTHATSKSGLCVNTAKVATEQKMAAIDTINALGLNPEDFKCRPAR